MMLFLSILLVLTVNWHIISPLPKFILASKTVVLAKHEFSLDDRYSNKFVNDVFKDNILLTLHYLAGAGKIKKPVLWEDVEKPFHYSFSLKPGETFAFHDIVLPEYQAKNIILTTKAHFNSQDGFRSDGYLFGDGVCHLASLLYWTAKDAGLKTEAPTNHNFAVIPQVPKEYGVSIYNMPGTGEESSKQNLYITNDRQNTITFSFDYNGHTLTIATMEEHKQASYLL